MAKLREGVPEAADAFDLGNLLHDIFLVLQVLLGLALSDLQIKFRR